MPLAAALPVVVANPPRCQISPSLLAKPDHLDARILAHSGEASRPTICPLQDSETQALAALLARGRQVKGMLVSDKNWLGWAFPEVRPCVQDHISHLDQEFNGLNVELCERFRQSPVLHRKDDLFRSVLGEGNRYPSHYSWICQRWVR